MNNSSSISSNSSFSFVLPLILIVLFAVAFSACDSPAGNVPGDSALNTQSELNESDDTDVIYKDLGVTYYGGGSSKAINNQGQAVGYGASGEYDTRAIRWGGGIRKLYGVGNSQGYFFSVAEDINNKGQVVGHDNFDAMLWEEDAMTALGNLGGDKTLPQAINENEQIVGYGEITDNYYAIEHAFLWDSGTIADLGTLCFHNENSRALAINEKGQVVGWSETHKGKTHAFLWEDGKMTDLDIQMKPNDIIDINDSGKIIINQGGYKSILLENGNKTELNFGAISINNKGQILGVSENARLLIWEKGKMSDITFKPEIQYIDDEKIQEVSDLNDVGQITGIVKGVGAAPGCDGPEDIGPACREADVEYGFILNTGL